MSFLIQSEEIQVFDEKGLMDFNGNQTVQGPNESFIAALKGFKRHQTMNKGLI